MAQPKRQATNTGNIAGKAPILASAKQSTADDSKPSQASIGVGQNDTKPVSVAEALSLWQTACFDLQSSGFKLAILARDNKVFMLLAPPASIGNITFEAGHLRIEGKPVSEL